MTDEEAAVAVLQSRLDHLEPRVEHIHKKGHDTCNKVIDVTLQIQDLRHSVQRDREKMDELRAMTATTVEAANALAGKADVDRERFKAMQSTMNSVLNSIRAVAIGSIVVVLGAALTEALVK